MTREKLMEDIIKEFGDKVIGDCFAGGLFKDNKAQKMYTSGYKDGFNSAKNTTKNFLKKALTKAYKEGQKFGKKDKRILNEVEENLKFNQPKEFDTQTFRNYIAVEIDKLRKLNEK